MMTPMVDCTPVAQIQKVQAQRNMVHKLRCALKAEEEELGRMEVNLTARLAIAADQALKCGEAPKKLAAERWTWNR